MDFQQYYPTPPELAKNLVGLISRDVDGIALEPSAGQGNIVEAFKRRCSMPIHCIEINSERAAILKGKDYPVVWDDFLTFNPLTPYNVIVMNPPFHDGAKHLLKALKILPSGGEIACILNAETIRNPYTNERKDLIRRLEETESYSIDFVQNAFADAENPTGVEIALVYAKKKVSQVRCVTFEGFKKSFVDEQCTEFQAIRRRGEIDGLIDNYRAEVQTAFRLYDEIQAYSQISLKTEIGFEVFELKVNQGHARGKAGIIKAINRNYWTRLLYSKELSRLLTSEAQHKYLNKLGEMSEFEFSERNILQLKIDLTRDLLGTIEVAIMNTWEMFTSKFAYNDYSKNIHYYNGWKTNKSFKINRKVIIPLNAFHYFSGDFDPMFTVADQLSDIEKSLNYLDCGRTEDSDMLNKLKVAQAVGINRDIDTKYFTVTLFKKGTCHLTFKDTDLLKKFNLYVGRKFNWLPDGYGTKAYADLTSEEKSIADSFEGRESYEDTFRHQEFYLPQPQQSLPMLAEGQGLNKD